MDVDTFISRWSGAAVTEKAHGQSFIRQLCEVLGVPAPDDERPGDRGYSFERSVNFDLHDGGSEVRWVDCYRRGCFVLESKQSDQRRRAEWQAQRGPVTTPRPGTPRAVESLMRMAKLQAEAYAKGLDEWPPFLVIIDVGRSIELWSDFSGLGKTYAPFPDRARQRITLEQLRDPDIRKRLNAVWVDPMSLDPTRHSAQVTTDISGQLARLTRSIASRAPVEAGHAHDALHQLAWASKASTFLLQCLFAMFAASLDLIPRRTFTDLLEDYADQPQNFHLAAGHLFRAMDRGGHCAATHQTLRRFNGGLFQTDASVELTGDDLAVLFEAAKLDWSAVEPAIFGALLEQALDPKQRAELGAHYTPRPFVETLVQATIMGPLRADWESVQATAITEHQRGNIKPARSAVRDFHQKLCNQRILDPACGTGNFLYVAMHMLKELECEVLSLSAELGDPYQSLDLDGSMVGPAQFLGLEKNARAAAIAEVVMWIGHLQWGYRVRGRAQPSDPVLRDFRAIQTCDALLDCDLAAAAKDLLYVSPRPQPWPAADFIIGNPPFMGAKDQRRELGDAYVNALWDSRAGRFRSADLSLAWWDRAAGLLAENGARLRRFGFITTNSLNQTFSRRVLEHHLQAAKGLRLTFAIADHPWVKGPRAAAVRVAMTAVEAGAPDGRGRLLTVISETPGKDGIPVVRFSEQRGSITPELTLGSNTDPLEPLRANARMASRGVQLMGPGFLVAPDTAARLLETSDPDAPSPFRPYRNGRDLTDHSRDLQVIDLFGWDEREVRRSHPGVFQHLLTTVKPDRDRNRRTTYRDAWWVFGEPRRELRAALEGLTRYIVTVETAKHRWFRFLDSEILPDNRLVCMASDDPYVLGVLSSRAHQAWARTMGGRLEDRPVYSKTRCFDAFPFPEPGAAARQEIAAWAEELDQRRLEALSADPDLTMTALYNLRAESTEAVLDDAMRDRRRRAMVELIDYLHRRLDGCVAAAYGWPADLADGDMVARLRTLHRRRHNDELDGRVAWTRPDLARLAPVQPRALPALEFRKAGAALPATDDVMARVLLERLRAERRPMQSQDLADAFAAPRRQVVERISRVMGVLAVAGSVFDTHSGWFAPERLG